MSLIKAWGLLTFCFLFFGASAQAGEADDKRYEGLVTVATENPAKADYDAMRSAYAASKYYRGSKSDPFGLRLEFLTSKSQPSAKVQEQAKAAVKTDFALPGVHENMILIGQLSKNSPEYKFHLDVLRGLVKSILDTGDGKSAKTAFVVLCVSEEYLIMNVLKLKQGNQAVTQLDDASFDVLTVDSTDGNAGREVWFDISAFYGR